VTPGAPVAGCPLCEGDGGKVLYQDLQLRVVEVTDEHLADYPGYLRVILKRHVREMTDLAADEAQALFRVVLACEKVLRAALAPDKVNLASLGNQAPHLHWHVVPRFLDDAHFPDAVWAARKRDISAATLMDRRRRALWIGESLRLALP
jgi:diadenosine tetraphosphate (Ap4A) HIT family hydrolase